MSDLKIISANISGVTLFENINLEKYTTMRLVVKGNLLQVETVEALTELLSELSKIKMKYHLVGWGANQVLLNTTDVVFIHLKFNFNPEYLKNVRSEYVLPASLGLVMLTAHAKKFGLKGWEVFTGIPASLGGAVCMNAGTGLGEIGNIVKSVKVVRSNGEILEIKTDKDSFRYRGNNFLKENDIIIEVTLVHEGLDKDISNHIAQYLEYRKNTQPINTLNCGCVFKNHSTEMRAGQKIDELGLKGYRYKNLRVSPIHANFFENLGGATSQDFYELAILVQNKLLEEYGIKFEFEVKIY